jgi:hypothetical protein
MHIRLAILLLLTATVFAQNKSPNTAGEIQLTYHSLTLWKKGVAFDRQELHRQAA